MGTSARPEPRAAYLLRWAATQVGGAAVCGISLPCAPSRHSCRVQEPLLTRLTADPLGAEQARTLTPRWPCPAHAANQEGRAGPGQPRLESGRPRGPSGPDATFCTG